MENKISENKFGKGTEENLEILIEAAIIIHS